MSQVLFCEGLSFFRESINLLHVQVFYGEGLGEGGAREGRGGGMTGA